MSDTRVFVEPSIGKASAVASASFPLDCFKVCLFTHYGHHDPAGLCDGGDYHNGIQFRLEKHYTTMDAEGRLVCSSDRKNEYVVDEDGNPVVYISFEKPERGEWWAGTMPYKKFWEVVTEALRPHLKRHER